MALSRNASVHFASSVFIAVEPAGVSDTSTPPVSDTPMLTAADVRLLVRSSYTFALHPSLALGALLDAYRTLGVKSYGAIEHAFIAYRSYVEESGARTLTLAARARDMLARYEHRLDTGLIAAAEESRAAGLALRDMSETTTRVLQRLNGAGRAFEDLSLSVLGKSAAALMALEPTLSPLQHMALATYRTVNTVFTSTSRALAVLLGPPPPIVYTSPAPVYIIAATSTSLQSAAPRNQ